MILDFLDPLEAQPFLGVLCHHTLTNRFLSFGEVPRVIKQRVLVYYCIEHQGLIARKMNLVGVEARDHLEDQKTQVVEVH